MTFSGNVANEPRNSSFELGNVLEFSGILTSDIPKMKGEDEQMIQPGEGHTHSTGTHTMLF